MKDFRRRTTGSDDGETEQGAHLGRRGFISGASAIGAAVVAGSGLVAEDADAQVEAPQIVSAWGATPKVLTVWRFKVLLPRMIASSTSVSWSGTGTFKPDGPTTCLATFKAPGHNTVNATIVRDLVTQTVTLNVVAKNADLYARMSSHVECPADAHGCPACPHPVSGKFIEGMPDLSIRGLPVVHVGHKGVHAACCGPNTFELAAGDPEVLVNGKAVGIVGSRTKHCGGDGRITGL